MMPDMATGVTPDLPDEVGDELEHVLRKSTPGGESLVTTLDGTNLFEIKVPVAGRPEDEDLTSIGVSRDFAGELTVRPDRGPLGRPGRADAGRRSRHRQRAFAKDRPDRRAEAALRAEVGDSRGADRGGRQRVSGGRHVDLHPPKVRRRVAQRPRRGRLYHQRRQGAVRNGAAEARGDRQEVRRARHLPARHRRSPSTASSAARSGACGCWS